MRSAKRMQGRLRPGNGVWWAKPTALPNRGLLRICTASRGVAAHLQGAQPRSGSRAPVRGAAGAHLIRPAKRGRRARNEPGGQASANALFYVLFPFPLLGAVSL